MGDEIGSSLITGYETSGSAKRRRQHAYRDDLQLQIREKDAARKREKYQGMQVNASGWLDPEKAPGRLKPLGGTGYSTGRTPRDTRVQPYHTLFQYDQISHRDPTPDNFVGNNRKRSVRRQEVHEVQESHPGVQPVTVNFNAGGNSSVDQAYNFFATRDLDQSGGFGSVVQPLPVPYVDHRPIIVTGRHDTNSDYTPKFNPFLVRDDSALNNELRAMINISHVESSRQKSQLAKENDEQQRRMRRELEGERRRLMSREGVMRRKMDEMQRDVEHKRREMDRQREAERLKSRTPDVKAVTPLPLVVRPSSTTLLSEMDETRRRLLEERLMVEGMLREQRNPKPKKIKRIEQPPPRPPSPDKANLTLIEEFTQLKNKEAPTRQMFRSVYPDQPLTNTRLEHQQDALIKHQEHSLEQNKVPEVKKVLTYSRPNWMDKAPSPFPHRLKKNDHLYTADAIDLELDQIDRRYMRAHRLDRVMDAWGGPVDADKIIDEYERMKLKHNRPASTETLTDDTWLRPISVTYS